MPSAFNAFSVRSTDVSECRSYAKRIVCKSNVFRNTLALSSCRSAGVLSSGKRFRIVSVNESVRIWGREEESESLEFINAIYFAANSYVMFPTLQVQVEKERSSETETWRQNEFVERNFWVDFVARNMTQNRHSENAIRYSWNGYVRNPDMGNSN